MNDYEVNSLRTRLDYTFDSDITLSYLGGYTDSTRVSRWDRSWTPGNYEWGGCIECNHDATQHEIQIKTATLPIGNGCWDYLISPKII